MKRALAAALLLAAGCGTFRAGEATIAESKAIRVKLVRYYERTLLDYTGYKYDVQCITPAGATTLGTSTEFANYNDNSPRALAERLRHRVTITPDGVVIWIDSPYILFAFDGCRNQAHWWPPDEMRGVHYRDVQASAGGVASFVAEGQGGTGLRVTREGKSWRQERMK